MRGKPSLAEKLARGVKGAPGPGDCWEWSGSLNSRGYGRITLDNGQSGVAHREAYRVHNGPIPAGLWVLHRCDNRKCVNPAHLFLGTNADNVADKVKKGRCSRTRHPGSSNAAAKLTEAGVTEIIRRLAAGERGSILAAEHAVGKMVISKIKNRKGWNHVPREVAP